MKIFFLGIFLIIGSCLNASASVLPEHIKPGQKISIRYLDREGSSMYTYELMEFTEDGFLKLKYDGNRIYFIPIFNIQTIELIER